MGNARTEMFLKNSDILAARYGFISKYKLLKVYKELIMNLILDELKRVEQIFDNFETRGKHRNRKYKEDREWWILGKTKQIFDKEAIKFPSYAKKLSENDTDFDLSFDGKNLYKKIQITECPPLDYLLKENSNQSINLWEFYKNIILKKLQYQFGKNNWLLIYFDIRYSAISENGFWHTAILRKSEQLDFSKCTYERIIIIDSKAEAAVSVYPFRYVIRPEWNETSTIVDQCIFRKSIYYSR